MFSRIRSIQALVVFWCVIAASIGRAQDILDNVPRDTLAMVAIRNLTLTRGHFMGHSNPANRNPTLDMFPFSVLAAFLGNLRQIDLAGDMLFVVRSSDRPLAESPLAVWLPIHDYAEFVRSKGGNPEDRITVITVQGEDVLCARQRDKWALLMDASDRPSMEKLLDSEPSPPPRLAAWHEWLGRSLISAAVFPTAASRTAIREWAGGAPNQAVNRTPATPRSERPAETNFLSSLRNWLGNSLATSPQLFKLAMESEAAAVGARIEEGTLVAGLRVAWPRDPWPSSPGAERPAPMLHREGSFSFSGAGRFPAPFARALTESVLRNAISEVRADNSRSTFDAELIEKFVKTGEEAAVRVTGAALFQTPGDEQEGVLTNQFLAVRVDSAAEFSAKIVEAARQWNEISATAQPSTKSVFEVNLLDIGDRKGTQLTLDIAASEGLPDSPELRHLMERLFGPDRKMHRWIVTLDEHTVLLTSATTLQTASAVKSLQAGPAVDWKAGNVVVTDRLLPTPADWKFFFNPSDYVTWLKRLKFAEFGEVVGEVPLEPFPSTPPAGIVGRFRDGEFTADVVVPSETMRAAHRYWVTRTSKQKALR